MQKIRSSLLVALGTAVVALCLSSLDVQTQPAAPPAIAPAPRIKLTAEQEHVIKEIIFKDVNVPKARADAPDVIGDAVPDNVQLYPFPPEIAEKVSQVRAHMFFVKGDEIVLVSPSDRLVAEVIKKSND